MASERRDRKQTGEGIDQEASPTVYIAPRKLTLNGWPNITSTRHTEDSEQPKQRLQGGNDTVVPPPPDLKSDLGFPRYSRWGA